MSLLYIFILSITLGYSYFNGISLKSFVPFDTLEELIIEDCRISLSMDISVCFEKLKVWKIFCEHYKRYPNFHYFLNKNFSIAAPNICEFLYLSKNDFDKLDISELHSEAENLKSLALKDYALSNDFILKLLPSKSLERFVFLVWLHYFCT